MSTDDSYMDEIYQRFNEAIMNAIVSSDDIRDLLLEIGSKGYINESSVFNLFLSLEELDSYMNPKAHETESAPSAGTPAPLNPELQEDTAPKSLLLIDGKMLSDKEREFEEYCSRKFDEGEWLKKVRIKL